MDIKQISYTKFRMHLASFINQVAKSNVPILIVRRNNEPAYLVSKEMYEYLLKQSPNKSKEDESATTSPLKKIECVSQEHVQVTTNAQQDLFS